MSGQKAKLEPARQETLELLLRYYSFVYKEKNAKQKQSYEEEKAHQEYIKYDFEKQQHELRKLGIKIPHLCRMGIQWDPQNPTVISWYGTDNGFEDSRKSYNGDFKISEPVAQIILDQMKQEAFELGEKILQSKEQEEKRLKVLAIVEGELAKV